jgi:transposase-like protein
MTREQAIRELKIQFIGEYDRQREAKDMAIKALEQESVLDKIRAEIENMQIVYDKSANYKDERTDEEKANDLGKMYKVLVLSIIDKYKAESENP